MDKTNTEDNSNPKNGSSTVRDSLVISGSSASVHKKHKKRSRDNSSESGGDDDNSSDSSHDRKRSKKARRVKKLKKKKSKKMKKLKNHSDSSHDSDSCKKMKRKKKDKKKSKKKTHDKNDSSNVEPLKLHKTNVSEDDAVSFGPAVPEEIENKSRAMVPMTKEEWEKQQSQIRRVYDSESGRHRLVRGDGEIIEECVSRDRHRQINKQATAADGLFFQMNVSKK